MVLVKWPRSAAMRPGWRSLGRSLVAQQRVERVRPAPGQHDGYLYMPLHFGDLSVVVRPPGRVMTGLSFNRQNRWARCR